jgi:hypothetical protein
MPEFANNNTKAEAAAIAHMMRRLDGLARGLGLDEAAIRQIVEKVAADMPVRSDEERLSEARARMVLALAWRPAVRIAFGQSLHPGRWRRGAPRHG